MHERPDRLPFSATRVVKASHELPWGAKAVWLEDWALDRGPEGAWISAANLAQRLGLSKDGVERNRRLLFDAGLYHVVRRHGARSDGWVAMLPPVCVPSERPGASEVNRLAAMLDAIITGKTGKSTEVPAPESFELKRQRVLARDPFCHICGVDKSEHVDHIVARRDGGSDDDANLQGLCFVCHARKTARERRDRRRGATEYAARQGGSGVPGAATKPDASGVATPATGGRGESVPRSAVSRETTLQPQEAGEVAYATGRQKRQDGGGPEPVRGAVARVMGRIEKRPRSLAE